MDKTQDLKILEAISLIASNTQGQISYDVNHHVDKLPFKKSNSIKRTVINIVITESI